MFSENKGKRRKMSAFVEDDRALDKDAEAVCEWLKKTDLFD